MQKFQCTQCGAADMIPEGKEFLRCKYCHSLFKMPQQKAQKGGVVIGSGANVVFGKNSNVVIKGGLSVSPGAHVSFLGKLEVVQKSSQEKIEQAKLTLQKEKEGKN
jgi:DNA-directed RNA polymerase subunit RPC12/RpoP